MALIYIVEDDQDIREIEGYALRNSGYTVQEFEYAAELMQATKKQHPDLMLLDIMLPDADGLEIVKQLRADPETAQIPIIMVTAKTTELDKVRGLDVGADDYLTKPFGIMELISRVKALLRRTTSAKKETLQCGPIRIDEEKHMVFSGNEACELTYKEYALLNLLLKNAGSVISREIILDRVWGTNFEGESRTLDMHIKTLRQKLGESGHLIRTVRNVGYIMDGQEEQ